MQLVVDVREAELMTHIRVLQSSVPQFRSVVVQSASLPLGDVVIREVVEEGAAEGNDVLLVERKSLSDLLASIKDGRYEEQSYRLNGLASMHNHNILYVVEGDVQRFGNRFKPSYQSDKLMLYSAMLSLNYFKGFSVMRTFSLEETAMFLCNTVVKLAKEKAIGLKTPFYVARTTKKVEAHEEDTPGGECKGDVEEVVVVVDEEDVGTDKLSSEKDYVSVVKRVKKENITANNIDEIMLCQIPGISSVTAQAIIGKYQSLGGLIKALEESRAAGESCLASIGYTNSKGQLRHISQTTLQNLSKYLLKQT